MVVLAFLLFLIFTISEIYIYTNSLGFLGFVIIVLYFGLAFLYLYKYYQKKDLNKESIFKFGFILLGIICFPLFFSDAVTTQGLINDEYKDLKESYNEGDYESVISSVGSLRRYDRSFLRADRLEEKAIHRWISECKKEKDKDCREDIFRSAIIHSKLDYAASEAFGYDKSEFSSKQIDEEENSKLKEAQEASEPFIGLEGQFISETEWGPPDEKEIIEHIRGDSYRYTWYFCEGNRQYSRSVMVKGDVYDVDSPDMGVPIEDIDSKYVKCPK